VYKKKPQNKARSPYFVRIHQPPLPRVTLVPPPPRASCRVSASSRPASVKFSPPVSLASQSGSTSRIFPEKWNPFHWLAPLSTYFLLDRRLSSTFGVFGSLRGGGPYHFRLWGFQLYRTADTELIESESKQSIKSGWHLLLEPALTIILFILGVLLLVFSREPRQESRKEYLLSVAKGSLIWHQVIFPSSLAGLC
jgi:hypothetical protein